MKKLLLIALILAAEIWLTSPVEAANCNPATSGSESISTSCSFPGLVNGVESGNITITAGDLTIPAGQTLVFNSGYSVIKSGGRIIKGSNSQLRKTYLWMTDADADGYAVDVTTNGTGQVAQDTVPTNGRRRANMVNIVKVDPNDTDPNIWQYFNCYADADNDTYTVGSLLTNVAKKTACNDPVGHQVSASGTADCYDSNANAKPGQTTYYTTNRGDGSFDYDCNGTSDKEYTATSNCI